MTTHSDASVLIDATGGVGWITLNRPKAYNALNRDMARLLDAVIRCDEDHRHRRVWDPIEDAGGPPTPWACEPLAEAAKTILNIPGSPGQISSLFARCNATCGTAGMQSAKSRAVGLRDYVLGRPTLAHSYYNLLAYSFQFRSGHLLRPGPERPRCHAPNQRNELPSPHSTPISDDGTLDPVAAGGELHASRNHAVPSWIGDVPILPPYAGRFPKAARRRDLDRVLDSGCRWSVARQSRDPLAYHGAVGKR